MHKSATSKIHFVVRGKDYTYGGFYRGSQSRFQPYYQYHRWVAPRG
jgi:hypothetical protein